MLSLLEPRLFANPAQLKRAAQADGLPFVLRRSKEQVTDLEGRRLFRQRAVKTVGIALTEAEKQLYDAVTAYVRRWYQAVSDRTDRRSRDVALALTVLQRWLSFSLFAVRESLCRRKGKLQHLKRGWVGMGAKPRRGQFLYQSCIQDLQLQPFFRFPLHAGGAK